MSDYRYDNELKESFNQLAIKTFDLDFSDWYKRGYWDEKYIPYSFVHHGKEISNASVYLMSLIIDGETYRAVQIGTVMTDQAYRNKGLATKLMQHIMDTYEHDCGLIFLLPMKLYWTIRNSALPVTTKVNLVSISAKASFR
ncbi:GNAT family N-acetyltransferase [Bacillus sp. FSL K6-2841]|uniref:GNAT family N-acetyltransferase n=1 Tax=Bacillus TaxID=1386 RepID=UPI0030D41030